MDLHARYAPPRVVDSHVHVWDPRLLSYPWLRDLPSLERPFVLDDFDAETADLSVDALVVVEANCARADALREARWFDSFAARDPRIGGIVAFVALDSADATARDDALHQLAAMPRVKGIRHNIQGEPPGFCLQPAFIDGVRTVGGRGFTFDLCATHDQLADVFRATSAASCFRALDDTRERAGGTRERLVQAFGPSHGGDSGVRRRRSSAIRGARRRSVWRGARHVRKRLARG